MLKVVGCLTLVPTVKRGEIYVFAVPVPVPDPGGGAGRVIVGIPVQLLVPEMLTETSEPFVKFGLTFGFVVQTSLASTVNVGAGLVGYPEPAFVTTALNEAGLRVTVAVVPEVGGAIVTVGTPLQIPGLVTVTSVILPMFVPVVPTVTLTSGSVAQTLLASIVRVGFVVVEYPEPALPIVVVYEAGLSTAVAVLDEALQEVIL